jgi:hypothetical protein
MKRFAAIMCVVGAMMGPTAAFADNTNAAQALFDEGRRLMSAGSYAEACPKFAESQKLDPGAGTLLNLALCYEKNEQFASAWITYNEAAIDADRSGRPEWTKKAKDKARELAPALSTLTVVVPKAARVEGLEVTRDGVTLSSAELGVKVPTDGGEHTIEAHAPNREPWTQKVTLAPKSGAQTVTVPVLPKSVEKKPDPVVKTTDKKPGSKGGTQRTIGVAVGAVGAVGLGLGAAFALNAMSKHNEAKKNCNADETRCGPVGLEDDRSAGHSADIATVAFAVGGALLVGGVVLYLTAPKGTSATALLHGWSF